MVERIFAGKEAIYNELILKVLYEKVFLTAWDLSKELAFLTLKPQESLTNKARNVQSRLIGKQRRLEDLVNKQFLEKTESNCYCLTFKGLCSASVLFDEHEKPKPESPVFSRLGQMSSELTLSMQMLSSFFSEEYVGFHKYLRAVTNSLLDKGLRIEKVSNVQFLIFLMKSIIRFIIGNYVN